MATVADYTCKSFIKLTPDPKFIQEEKGPPFTKKTQQQMYE